MDQGWYPDPDDASQRRYWDGSIWGPPLPLASVTSSEAPSAASPDRGAARRRARWLVLAAAVVAAATVVTLVVARSGNSSAKVIAVHGTMTLTDITGYSASDLTKGAPCAGKGGYSDINEGATVVVSDDSGKTLVITQLGTGSIDDAVHCEFDWSATIPAGKRFYGVTVTHRGTVKESEAEMSRIIALTLGD